VTGTAGFLRAVELRSTGEGDVFTARTQPVPWPKSYGGDLLAQASAAASATVGGDRALHAAHSLFVAPVPVGAEVRHRVERLRDGRSFSTRRVTATVDDEVVFTALCSFHTGEESDTIAATAPAVPDPGDLLPSAAHVSSVDSPAAEYWAEHRSFDIRHVDGPSYLTPSPDAAPNLRFWVRAFDRLSDDPAVHRLALVYLCDYTMLEPVLKARRLSWSTPGLTTASLDHSMWLHADARADEWLLCDLRAVSFAAGRALVSGEFFTHDGRHIASVAQQGVLRHRRPSAN
jgi:acyl-CoA thioesterase-2